MKGFVILLTLVILHYFNLSRFNYLVKLMSLRENNIATYKKIFMTKIINLKISPRLYN